MPDKRTVSGQRFRPSGATWRKSHHFVIALVCAAFYFVAIRACLAVVVVPYDNVADIGVGVRPSAIFGDDGHLLLPAHEHLLEKVAGKSSALSPTGNRGRSPGTNN
jgi:hypothetical protein